MLSPEEIARLAQKLQTSPLNAAREYAQHVFLSFLYQDPGSDALLFKGGTALRILHGSPRFSEDLDFSGAGSLFGLRKIVERTALKIRQEIHTFELAESKPTTGGYLGLIKGPIATSEIEILIQISLRSALPRGEVLTVTSPSVAPYTTWALPEDTIVAEKLDALLTRAKPRDFYDLYFILRKPLGNRRKIAAKRAAVLERLKNVDARFLYRELRNFLPRSHWAMIQRLPAQLRSELLRL